MSVRCVVSLVTSLMFVVAAPALGLEKRAARLPDDDADLWNLGSSCTISYYNVCTGWIWIWSGWSPESEVGVYVSTDECCPQGGTGHVLKTTRHFVTTGAPQGYGFTGTIGIYDASGDGCDPWLWAQPYVASEGWNTFFWGIPVESEFLMKIVHGTAAINPAGYTTDRPVSGPTGPDACGTCYPTTRVTNTFWFGSPANPHCPGLRLNDGTCDAELQFIATFEECGPVSVEEGSFGGVKALYRE